MFLQPNIKSKYISIDSINAMKNFSEAFYSFLANGIEGKRKNIVFVCIGTDRSTGDSFGPLIGYKIKSLRYSNVYVYGTLENPVHAKNLESVLEEVEMIKDSFVIAIDACLGKNEHVGYITVGLGPIKPGSGVKKELTPVGDMHITGIVNFGGFMDFLVLQNTRLSLVMKMAEIVSTGIRNVLWEMSGEVTQKFRSLDNSVYKTNEM